MGVAESKPFSGARLPWYGSRSVHNLKDEVSDSAEFPAATVPAGGMGEDRETVLPALYL